MQKIRRRNLIKSTHSGVILILSLTSYVASADELDTLQFIASETKTFDSNLFRRADNEVSEQINTTTLGVKLDKVYSLQHFLLDIKYIDYKYNESEYLDFQAKNYNASWLWSLTPHLTGMIASDKTQSLNSFTDFRTSLQKNVRTLTNNIVNLQYSPHDVWALIVGVSQLNLSNSAPFTAITDFDSVGADYGLKYQFSSGSNIKLMAHNRRGQYKKRELDPLNAFDNGYEENEYEINLTVPEANTHNFYVKVGHLEREYDNFSIRNYSAYVANVNYDLQLTGKLKSFVSYSRVISPFETSNSTYSLSDTIGGRLVYDISSKIKAGINLSYAERDFGGRGSFDTSGRSDKEYLFDCYFTWNPIKNIGFKINRTQSNRNSTVSRFDYDDTLTNLTIELKL